MRTQSPHHIPAIPQPTHPSVVFVSTYPPAICGLATFTSSLREAFARNRGSDRGLGVIALDDGHTSYEDRGEVISLMDPGDAWSIRSAAERVAGYDAVVLQHEYGIWGPDMGTAVLEFADRLDNRLITTLHTLLTEPTPTQRRIVEGLTRRSDVTVLPTKSARNLLLSGYSVDPRHVAVVPHGTTRHRTRVGLPFTTSRKRPRLLTWGLIGPGKGIETALEAVAVIRHHHPDVMYTVAGRTHPKVLAHQGEEYRTRLETMVRDLGIAGNVEFVDGYLAADELDNLILDADAVILPYDSAEQMVSGVLVEAVSAHVPVVATEFSHARELAEVGAVATSPHRDPKALAQRVTTLLDSPRERNEMARAQRMVSAGLDWDVVARSYEDLIEKALLETAVIGHVSTAS